MNILFIIGNGFDINLGLETKYTHFYKYYQTIKSKSDNIKKLKSRIKDDYKNWGDLETAFGEYTKDFISTEFDEIYEDVVFELAKYLNEQENKLDLTEINRDKFFKYLSFPEKSLSVGDNEELAEFRNKKWNNHYWNINIVTLNYTRTIEKIIGDTVKNLNIGLHDNNAPIVILGIEHIHGFTDERMVFGVNDISQISNKTFHENQELLDDLVKTNCNQAHNHKIDRTFKNQIADSNLICIYGSSIGNTDKCWWEIIGERLQNENCRLIIFSIGEEVSPIISQRNKRVATNVRKLFLEKLNLSEEIKLEVSKKIYVGINTKMFTDIHN